MDRTGSDLPDSPISYQSWDARARAVAFCGWCERGPRWQPGTVPASQRVISNGERLSGQRLGGGEVPMVTDVAKQVATSAGRSAISAADPVLAAKITAPDVSGLGRAAPADLRAAGPGHAVVPADCCHRASWSGQDDGPGVVGGGGDTGLSPGSPWTATTTARVLLVLRRRGTAPFRHCHPGGTAGAPRRSRQPITCSCSGWCRPWPARTHP